MYAKRSLQAIDAKIPNAFWYSKSKGYFCLPV